ncbi:MAG: hypothetical protein WA118_10750 [Carboxydocellales bacterium]
MKSTLTRPGSETNNFTAPEINGLLRFYGVVKNDNNSVVQGAIVMLFACLEDGVENSLGYTCTDKRGQYFLTTPSPTDYTELIGFKVRACINGKMPEIIALPENYVEEEPNSFAQNEVEEACIELGHDNVQVEYENVQVEYENVQVKHAGLKQKSEALNDKKINEDAVSKRYFLPPQMDNTLTDSASGSVAYLRGNEIWVTVFGR